MQVPVSIDHITVRDAQGQDVPLSAFPGVRLIVNTASRCGFTPQYEGLEALHRRYHDRGLQLLAFPCNQFGGQDPGSLAEIREFCSIHYDVTFPILAKVEVNGAQEAALFTWLKARAPGLMGSRSIKWNFTKFLVARDGISVRRFAPTVKPEALETEIEARLAARE